MCSLAALSMQIFVTFSLTRRPRAGTAAEKIKKGKSERGRKKEARWNGGARSRRIIKCVLPRKFIFILESITRKRRRARGELPFSLSASEAIAFLAVLAIAKSLCRVIFCISSSARAPGKTRRASEKRIHRRLHIEINCYSLIHT